MIQSWVLEFNPDNANNLTFPTWVALRDLLFKNHDHALTFTDTLGGVLGSDIANDIAKDLRFYINLKVNKA